MAKPVFPLPENYFPEVGLNTKEIQAFQTWADALLQETIDMYHAHQRLNPEQRERKWKLLKQRNGLSTFRRRKGTEEEGDEFRYLCTGKIDGRLDEIMLGRYADTTDSFRRMSAIYREDLIDCAVLRVMEKQSPAKPFFFSGFKWMTVQSPGKGLVKNRDVCFFEQMGITKDRTGKEIGYTITESVDLPSCPPFDSSVCVRARLSVCYLYKRNKYGGVKVFMRGKNNAGGKVMDWIKDMKSAELWLRIERALPTAHAYIGTEMVKAAPPTERQLLGTNNRCEVCSEKTSSLMVSQKECTVCHRITCSRCVAKRRILSDVRDFLFVQHANFCKRCVRYIPEIDLRDPNSIKAIAEAAAKRGDPLTSSYSRRCSHSSQASGDTDGSRDPERTFSSHDYERSFSNASGYSTGSGYSDPSLSSFKYARQQGPRQNDTSTSLPTPPQVMLHPDVPTASAVRYASNSVNSASSRGHHSHHHHVPVTNSIESHSSFASSYAESVDSDASPSQMYHKHLVSTTPMGPPSSKTTSTALAMPPPPPSSQHEYATPESMMAQMIRMNIMAEQARQMVKDNDKFTRQFAVLDE